MKACKHCKGTKRIKVSGHDTRFRYYSQGLQALYQYDAETDSVPCIKCRERLDEVVKKMLVTDARTRDNDRLLIALIWHYEFKAYHMSDMSADNFIRLYGTSEMITSADSITRIRRKLQEEFPELRGVSFKTRQTKAKKFLIK